MKRRQGCSDFLRVDPMKRLPVLGLVILLAGCTDKVWVKEGATYKDFDRDKALCMQKSQVGRENASPQPSEDTADPKKFAACMAELGYELEYDRPLNPRRFWRRD